MADQMRDERIHHGGLKPALTQLPRESIDRCSTQETGNDDGQIGFSRLGILHSKRHQSREQYNTITVIDA